MPATRTSATLDPRSPFVLDTHELGRRAGSMRTEQRRLAAPDGWELGLVSVPAGASVDVELRLESVMDGVLVTGTVSAPMAAECGRCLEPLTEQLRVDVQELFTYEPDPADPDIPVLDGDFIDLEPLLRDTVLLGLPANPVCAEDCEGLCATCGARLADSDPADHRHDEVDPRWAALAGLTSVSEPTATPDTAPPTEES